MTTELEDLRVFRLAEAIADETWNLIARWKPFERDSMGKQLARALDSIGANIAEAYGRYHYGQRINFLYYARGSIYESQYWLKRAAVRGLITAVEAQEFSSKLTDLVRQLNSFIASLKKLRFQS